MWKERNVASESARLLLKIETPDYCTTTSATKIHGKLFTSLFAARSVTHMYRGLVNQLFRLLDVASF